jgi:predicted ATP-dependent endonuclease of OLD family
MKLEKIQIKNFRSFHNETICVDPYTCLVGPNGAGKSTILCALNLFFRDPASPTNMLTLCAEDFHHGNTAEPVEIILAFKDLSADAQEDLKHYYRQHALIVMAKAEWDPESQMAEVKQFGIRNVMKEFAPYFKAVSDGEKAPRLKEIYDGIQKTFTELPKATTGPAREAALRQYEEEHPELCSPVTSEAQFFGFTKGANLLERYVEWVYVPAVKDASTEQTEAGKCAFKELLDRTVRTRVNFKDSIAKLKKTTEEAYRGIVESEAGALSTLQESLHNRLKDWYTPSAMLKLAWHVDGKSVAVNEPTARAALGEDNFVGEVARLGHGMQRSFIISMLHELAMLNAENGPTLLLGFEEPELYQHPPQAQHVAGVLEQLANDTKTNAQILLSTHSPYFVSTKGFENVRVVRKHPVDKCSLVAQTTYVEVEASLAAALGAKPDLPSVTMTSIEQIMQPSQKELYFCKFAVLVEGPEDVGFISSYLVLNGHWNDFRRMGCHFVVTGGKTSMSRPLAIAKKLCIRTFAIIDADVDKGNIAEQRRDNLCILRLCGIQADPMPAENQFHDNCVIFSPRIADVVKAEAGSLWNAAEKHVREAKGFLHGSNQKNKLFIAGIMEELQRRGFVSESLARLTARLLGAAEKPHPVVMNDGIAPPSAESTPNVAEEGPIAVAT